MIIVPQEKDLAAVPHADLCVGSGSGVILWYRAARRYLFFPDQLRVVLVEISLDIRYGRFMQAIFFLRA